MVKKKYHNQERGVKAEFFVIEKLQARGLVVDYINSWYDIKIGDKKIEIKSASLSVKSSGRKKGLSSWEFGRFDFTNEDNRDKIWSGNIWVCFVIRWRTDFLILGFVKAKCLPKRRYQKISFLRDKPELLDLNKFVERLKNEHATDV